MVYMVLDTKQDKFLVKVGLSRDVRKRIGGYRTHNPFATFLCACAGTEAAEQYCHTVMRCRPDCIGVPGSEWFIVSEEFYNECKEKGLKVFDKFQKNKITWYDR